LQGTDTAAPYTYGWTFTSTNNGTHQWTARAYDTANNVATSAVVGLTVNIVTSGCSYALSIDTVMIGAEATNSSVEVIAGAGCAWPATSNDGWITIDSGSSGVGNGTVGYTVAANTSGGIRTGSVSIAGLTLTVIQDASTSCTYSITPTSASFGSASGSGSFSVMTGSGCGWSANSDSTSWLQTTSSGNGDATVNYSYDANTGDLSRTGHIMVGGQIFTVTQAAAVNHPPVFSSLSVSNMMLIVGDRPIATVDDLLYFTVAASDPDGNALAYLWTFCDGTTNTAPVVAHQITNAGPCLVNILVSDGQLATSSNLTVFVAWAMTVTNVQAKLNFTKLNGDSCRLTGTLDLGDGFSVTNKLITLDVGGAQVSFTLDAKGKGRGVSSFGSCKLKQNKKTGLWSFSATMKKGSWQDTWSSSGLVNATIRPPGVPVQLRVILVIDDQAFTADAAPTYTAKAGRSGLAQ